VNYSSSQDGGKTFAKPVRVDSGNAMGRVDAVMFENGDAIVSWLEQTGEDAQIMVRKVFSNGSLGNATVVSKTSASRTSGFPRMAKQNNETYLAWTEIGETANVQLAILDWK
jgi:hypothetical protein